MTTLITFLLATTGLTFIATKSLLFKGIRVYVSQKYADFSNEEKFGLGFWRFLTNVITCPMCFSVYAGAFCAIIIYFSQSYPNSIYILYPFCGTAVATLIVQHYSKMEKQ